MKKRNALIVIALLCFVSIVVYAHVEESNRPDLERCPECLFYYVSQPVYKPNGVWVYTCTVCGSSHVVYVDEPQDTTTVLIQKR